MAQITPTATKRVEIAHVLQNHIGDYKHQHRLWGQHQKIITDLLNCRTAHLGGRVDRCDACGSVRITYYSCRNRHCPKCQHMPRERWLEKRKDEILPVNYFHVVFTLPHELNGAVLNNKKVMLNCLFTAAAQTLLRFGHNELGGTMGFLAFLHTWDQKLNAHFHLHCLVPGGAAANGRWVGCRKRYLFNQRALSLVFRAKFMQLVSQARAGGTIVLDTERFGKLKRSLFAKNWVVSVREPVKRAEHVLEYLARYTHRVAIANSRIKSLNKGMVTFIAKNRKQNRNESVTISAVEFIRRFLLHSLPKGFVRIRHYGFLANRNRRKNLSAIRQLFTMAPPVEKQDTSCEQLIKRLTGIDISVCPCCSKGKMRLVYEIPLYRARSPTRFTTCAR
jgi:hypothetical protein